MKPKHLATIIILWVLVFPATPARAGGVVTTCDETNLLAVVSGGGMVTFTCSGTILLNSTITIAANTTIDGSGQEVTIDGNGAVRVFTVSEGVTLNLNKLTVTGGYCIECDGGGIYNDNGIVIVTDSTFSHNAATYTGGRIISIGTLIITNSSFSDNIAAYGGGIYNYGGTLTITGSTFSRNEAFNGGGIISGGDLTITNSTFSSNTVPEGFGGGIYNYSTATITNSTFSSNSASDGGGIYNEDSVEGSTVRLSSTIVAYSTSGWNCHGTITDQDGNISFPDATCPGFQEDPLLGPLQDNGGLTRTHALLPGSTAIDAGSEALCPDLDQRGVPRPVDGNLDGEATCDIGAFEYQYHPLRLFLPLVQRVP